MLVFVCRYFFQGLSVGVYRFCRIRFVCRYVGVYVLMCAFVLFFDSLGMYLNPFYCLIISIHICIHM